MKTLPTRSALLLAVIAGVSSVAIARAARDDDKPQAKPTVTVAKATPEQQKQCDEKFLKCAASGNMLTVKMSEYAAEQVTDPEVKKVAEMLVKHHGECQTTITETAKQSNVELPQEMSAVDKAKLEAFKENKGDMVTAPYLFCLTSGHVHAILEVSCEQKSTQDAAIKGYCEKSLPVLKKHLMAVKPMAEAVAGIEEMRRERTE